MRELGRRWGLVAGALALILVGMTGSSLPTRVGPLPRLGARLPVATTTTTTTVTVPPTSTTTSSTLPPDRALPAGWASPRLVSPLTGGAADISCPTATDCVLLDADGLTFTWNGAHWGPAIRISSAPFHPSALSCPTPRFCAVIDQAGHGATWNGTSWSQVGVIDASTALSGAGRTLAVNALSCASAELCMAVDTFGQAVQWTGSAWSTPVTVEPDVSFQGLDSVSCPSPTSCLAGGDLDQVFRWDGTSWSAAEVIPDSSPNPNRWVSGISCPTPTFCAAVASQFAVDTWNGTVWAGTPGVPGGARGNGTTRVSCATATFCVTTGFSQAYSWTGSAWSDPHPFDPDRGLVQSFVSCPSPTTCLGADAWGAVAQWAGTGWSPSRDLDPSGGGLDLLTCPTTQTCLAAVTGSAVGLSAWANRSWRATTPPGLEPFGGSCVTGPFCLLFDGTSVTTGNGLLWTPPTPAALVAPAGPAPDGGADTWPSAAVSCLSDRFCALVADDGQVAIWLGTGWTGQQSFGLPAGTSTSSSSSTTTVEALAVPGPIGVSCSQTWACTAILGDQVLTWDGDSWTQSPYPDQSAAAVSCPRPTTCIFVGRHDVDVEVSGAWRAPQVVDPTGLLTSVSCPTTSFCVALDGTGHAVTFDGSRWSAPRAVLPDDAADGIGVNRLDLVDCPSASFCLAVSPGGSATTYLPPVAH